MWDLDFAVRFVLGKSMAALMPGHSMKRMKTAIAPPALRT